MKQYWRSILACLPLPMLALAASYGVYSYACLFVPQYIAVMQAAAFEITYIGLAVVQVKRDQRNRARMIAIGAVLASIIYNSLAGWFYRQPAILAEATTIAWLMLAILHGAPLAWVAFLVSDLLLHRDQSAIDDMIAQLGQEEAPPAYPINNNVQINVLPSPEPAQLLEAPATERTALEDALAMINHPDPAQRRSIQEAAGITGLPYTTLWRKNKQYIEGKHQ